MCIRDSIRVNENPYSLIEDVEGIGFKTADKIAAAMGIEHSSTQRLRAGLRYMLLNARQEGHTYMPEAPLINLSSQMLGVDEDTVGYELSQMRFEGSLVGAIADGEEAVYLPALYYMEKECAKRLLALSACEQTLSLDIRETLLRLEQELEIELAPKQREAVAAALSEGVMVITGGPGTGKTYTLVLRTLYLILTEKAKPSEIVLTSFTEKSAFELRDRIGLFSKKLGERLNLHELTTGTIHSICDKFNNKFIKETPLKKNYTVLDDLTSPLFINEHFAEIIEPFHDGEKYFGRWKGKWDTIGRIKNFFDKITEELIDPEQLIKSKDGFLSQLGESYIAYRDLLFENNRIDFSFQQRIFYDLLQKEDTREKIATTIKYMLIDEYQDTNYIQEQIALTLVKPHNNLTVVGDEDQACQKASQSRFPALRSDGSGIHGEADRSDNALVLWVHHGVKNFDERLSARFP